MNVAPIVDLIRDASPDRSFSNIKRRGHKVLEELGEIEEAYLNVTSTVNGKGKTWADVREEAVDAMIVATDIALTWHEADDKEVRDFKYSYLIKDIETHLLDYKDSSYDSLIWLITAKLSDLGITGYISTPMKNALAGLSFALVELVWNEGVIHKQTIPDARDQIVSEVQRKLAKWEAAQKAHTVVSDNVKE